MKNIATYSARRTNLFVWLAAIMMVASSAARIAFFAGAEAEGVLAVVVRIILPVAANLFIAIRLPLRGEKFFYVTVRPSVLLAICYVIEIFHLGLSVAMTIACLAFCILQMVMFYKTFTGEIHSTVPVLLAYLAFAAIACLDKTFLALFVKYWMFRKMYLIAGLGPYIGLLFVILSARKLPNPVPGEPYRPRYGDRMDGRLIRSTPPLDKCSPYFMVTRNTSSNLISDSVEVSNMQRYIHQKRREGLKHFGITHVLLAAYVRCCAEFPAVNRFVSGQKVYKRYTIDVNMMVKKEMLASSPETAIKVIFDPADDANAVYEKFDAAVQKAKENLALEDDFDKAAAIFNYVPGLLLKFLIWLIKTMDYFGILPLELINLSPFHGSLFITSMGSLGIPPIYHHLYDFGNVSQFCAFGAKRTEYILGPEGDVITKKFVDYKFVTDERIVDGFNYAAVFKRMRSLLMRPDQLDTPVEVKEDRE